MSKYRDRANRKAVALKYDSSQSAPIVVASGLGYMAEKIVEVATEHDLPVYEDSALATVLSQLDLGTQIPPSLYEAIVEIYVYFLKGLPEQLSADADFVPPTAKDISSTT